jgi:hypothetical protein
MTVVTFNCFGSKSHLRWLFTAFFRSVLKTAVPDVTFTTKECRAVTKHLFFKEKTPEEIHGDMSLTSGEKQSFLLDS